MSNQKRNQRRIRKGISVESEKESASNQKRNQRRIRKGISVESEKESVSNQKRNRCRIRKGISVESACILAWRLDSKLVLVGMELVLVGMQLVGVGGGGRGYCLELSPQPSTTSAFWTIRKLTTIQQTTCTATCDRCLSALLRTPYDRGPWMQKLWSSLVRIWSSQWQWFSGSSLEWIRI